MICKKRFSVTNQRLYILVGIVHQRENSNLVWTDCNRMASFSAWGLHELLLTTLVELSGEHPTPGEQRGRLNKLRPRNRGCTSVLFWMNSTKVTTLFPARCWPASDDRGDLKA